MAFDIEHTHPLSTTDARERLRALGDYFQNKHGLAVAWQGDDEATVAGRYLVVTIEGKMTIAEGRVRFSGKDPGMLWRGKAKDYLLGKLAKYLDPKATLDSLPRR